MKIKANEVGKRQRERISVIGETRSVHYTYGEAGTDGERWQAGDDDDDSGVKVFISHLQRARL